MPARKPINSILAVIFDFDYTLADTSRGAIECIQYAFRQMQLPKPSEAACCRTIGMSLSDTYTLLSGDGNSANIALFTKHFVKKADEVMEERAVIFNGVLDVLTALRNHGMKLGVVSTKFQHRIDAILTRNNLRHMISVIMGGENVKNQKPDPEGICHAARILGVPLKNILYVGDSLIDAEAAKRAGTQFAAVLTGVTQKEAFLKGRCTAVYSDLGKIYQHVMDHNANLD